MGKLKKGMYVRCSIDEEDYNNPRKFILGQITKINESFGEAIVKFYDLMKARKFFDNIPETKCYDIEEINRCRILDRTKVILTNKQRGTIVYSINSNEKDEYYQYYIKIESDDKTQYKIVKEKDLFVQFTRAAFNPINQLIDYEFHNPIWYNYRNIVSSSMHTLKNAAFGFETLIGSRVHLLSHQVDTIMRAIRENPCRLVLADEVGLGKTVEACVIMKGLKEKNKGLKTLIIAPDSLVHQWKNELSYKFWLDIPIYTENKKNYEEDLIMPLEKLSTPKGQIVLNNNWDLCIIDETHRLIGMKNEYNAILKLSQRVDNMLLLTATPVQQRKTEYLSLLALLKPEIYKNLSVSQFENILEKQSFLRGKIHQLMRDLEYYEEDESPEDYLDDLNAIGEELQDDIFIRVVKNIDIQSEDMGLRDVKLALAYLGEHYQIERRIIRHRRMELKDKMPNRKLYELEYHQAGSEYFYYEADVYNQLISYLESVSQGDGDSILKGEFIRVFLSAVFSSPWALQSVLKYRRKLIKENKFKLDVSNEIYMLNTPRKERERRQRILSAIESFDGELDIITELIELTELWEKGAYNEFNNLKELYNEPHLIKGRLLKIIDYLSDEFEDTKYVLFTSWSETLEKIEELLTEKFGDESCVSFYSGKDDEELQQAADLFQSSPKCRFIICDELGGEGRNFQSADGIVHIDLPWSPVQLEQRIGRLDRIGRDKEKKVLSIVVYAKDTIEEELFKLWDEGLNVFNESLSGLEIILQEIQYQVYTALGTDLKYGMSDALNNIKEYSKRMAEVVEEERYFDMARHLDTDLQYQLQQLIDSFNDEDGKGLHDIMIDWSNLTGLVPYYEGKDNKIVVFSPTRFAINSIRNTLLIPPDMEEARKRSKQQGQIRGTFSRSKAIKREDIIFYAPGDPFFDAITNNAIESSRGRSCAYLVKSNIVWKGLVFKWSANIDMLPLIELGEELEKGYKGFGYMNLNQIITLKPLNKGDMGVNHNLILDNLNIRYKKSKYYHLGKRTSRTLKFIPSQYESNLEWFKYKLPPDKWSGFIKNAYKESYQEAYDNVKSMIDLERAKRDFENELYGINVANLFYNRNDKNLDKEYNRISKINEAIIKGLENPKVVLDSVAFVWMVKDNG